MAYCDYQHCDVCDCKTFYDARIDWDDYDVGEISTLCRDCAKTHKLIVAPRDSDESEGDHG
jgi:hypothetical protein